MDSSSNVLASQWQFSTVFLFFQTTTSFYWLSGVPGVGGNNSGGVTGTKNRTLGETSGGVGGGGPGGVPGCARNGLRDRSLSCDQGGESLSCDPDGGNAHKDLRGRRCTQLWKFWKRNCNFTKGWCKESKLVLINSVEGLPELRVILERGWGKPSGRTRPSSGEAHRRRHQA